MERGQFVEERLWYQAPRILISGALVCVLALAWLAGKAPAAHASGVPYCPNPLLAERAPTQPAINLNRTEGPAGTDLTVSASGWRAGVHVALHFDGRNPKTGELYVFLPQLAQGTVATDGAITLTSIQTPSFYCVDMRSYPNVSYDFGGASGSAIGYLVLASDDGEVSAPVAFKFLPPPIVTTWGVDPAFHDARIGSTITVTGTGWEAHEPLTLTLRQPLAPSALVPYAAQTHATTDAQGNFTTSYPLYQQLHWGRDVMLTVEGSGPRFGSLAAQDEITLLPAVQPTFQVDHTLVTPGMKVTVSGERWFPGDVIPLKLCNAQIANGVWSMDGNCGKATWPKLAEITVDASGRLRQQVTIPANTPPGESIFVIETNARFGVQPIPVRVVDHLPTWDDIHPRLAAARNTVVASLPFSIPAVLLLGALAFFAVRRWRGRQRVA